VILPGVSEQRVSITVVYGSTGDSMDRLLCRLLEVLCSVSIILQVAYMQCSAAARTHAHSYLGLHGVLMLFMQYRC